MKNIIIIGSGGHATSCIDVIEQSSDYKIKGIVNNSKAKNNTNYPIIGDDSELDKIILKYQNILIGVGQIKDHTKRKNLYKKLVKIGFNLPSIQSPNSYVSSNSIIGNGNIIMHDVIVNANSKISNNCIINSKSLLEHDTYIESNTHISTGTIINGGVLISEGSFIGSGCIINENVKIGRNCIIGSGMIIKKDISSNKIVK